MPGLDSEVSSTLTPPLLFYASISKVSPFRRSGEKASQAYTTHLRESRSVDCDSLHGYYIFFFTTLLGCSEECLDVAFPESSKEFIDYR